MTPEQALETLVNSPRPSLREIGDVLARELERLHNDLGRESMRCEKAEDERDAAVAERDKAVRQLELSDEDHDILVAHIQGKRDAALADARQLREALELAVQSIEDAYGGYAFVPENTLEHDAVVQGHACQADTQEEA